MICCMCLLLGITLTRMNELTRPHYYIFTALYQTELLPSCNRRQDSNLRHQAYKAYVIIDWFAVWVFRKLMVGVEPTSPYSTLTLRLPFQSFNQLNYISSFDIRLITPDIYFLEKWEEVDLNHRRSETSRFTVCPI